MTEPHWRVAWLMKQLGGRENLPPKLTSPAEEEAPPSNKPTNYDSEEEERKNLPKIDTPAAVVEIQNARLQQLKDSATASAANPRASAASMSDFGFESVAFDERKGQPAPLGISFAPFAAVAKYCYTFVPPKWLQPFATEFFDNEKIYTRDWDLCVSQLSPDSTCQNANHSPATTSTPSIVASSPSFRNTNCRLFSLQSIRSFQKPRSKSPTAIANPV